MAVTQHKYIRIEAAKFGRRGLVYVGVCLLAALLICVVAGAVGPNVLRVQSGGTEELVVNKYGETKLLLDVSGFSSMSQFYWIEVEFTPTSDVRYEEINSIDIRLNVTGAGPLVLFRGDHHVVMDKQFSRDVTCRSSSCDKFFLFGQRQIFFESLTIDMVFTDPDSTFLEGNKLIVSVDVVTISPEYTKFEMIWKDIFLVATLFVIFTKDYGYLWKLVEMPVRAWSSQQTWILLLLLGLVMFNDPFFSLQVFTKYALQFSDFYIIMTSVFVTALLMFWLCTFDELRLDEGGPRDGGNPYATRRSMVVFFAPKGALMAAIFSVLVWLYLHLNSMRDTDPTYDGSRDNLLWAGMVVLISLVSVYSLYLFGLIVLNIDKIRAFSPPFMFVFAITMIAVTFTLVALASGYFFPFNVPAMIFVMFYAVINLYIWTMAFSYCPFSDSESFKYQLSVSSAFGEDYFDDVVPPSASSRDRIHNDNAPLISENDSAAGGFRQRLVLGSDARAIEKNNNRLELTTLGTRSNSSVIAAGVGAAGPLDELRGVAALQPKARQANRLSDFQSIEFT